MKIVFLNEKGGMFHEVTGEKLDIINLGGKPEGFLCHLSVVLTVLSIGRRKIINIFEGQIKEFSRPVQPNVLFQMKNIWNTIA